MKRRGKKWLEVIPEVEINMDTARKIGTHLIKQIWKFETGTTKE